VIARLVGLGAQPGRDWNATVAKHHEAVVKIAHHSRELEFKDLVERGDDGLGLFGVERRIFHPIFSS
jgi:hypothetical protein